MTTQNTEKTAYEKNFELLRRWREGDPEAGEELVLLNRPLIFHVASRFTGRAELSDLLECGEIGLVKAMKTFDFARGTTFSTYAVPLIFGEMRRFLRDDGIIKVSREEKKLCALLNAERERRIDAGEPTDIESVAHAVGVGREEAASALFAGTPVRSLEEAAYDGEGELTLGGTVAEEGEEEKNFDRLALRLAIEKLPENQRRLILLRYFRDLSQSEVAAVLGVSQVKVSREEKKILDFLRRDLLPED
ncbi:MAG: sigma-70 family RNA polymerase sigma factor [Clostridia bacterium]|nr:sigma-70 family RNA polymerase sigma factor [Clostridia bacterium]